MIDEHNACPACPQLVRDLYAVGRKVLVREREHVAHVRQDHLADALREYEELYLVLEALRPFVDAHYANQLHAFSKELVAAREPKLEEPVTP